ncbi:hypothetical protein N7466_006595 [Penicillium verhagenii]|uniref:uncharacterized protein n=1 Tax=Penicillium verhagenii TaxID=1562060 RepID=UPI002545350B|nr:uncharacterized protein N7466_006595 [Penicillium verhagenii]KAJ5931102.1 hypothetical protein N7466_006595 [Penicillium verhagenii]
MVAIIPLESRVKGAIWGNCVADALGGPVQFLTPGTFSPITDMELVNPVLVGSYSDDGAMTLALAQAFIDSAPSNYDHALAIQYFLEWWKFGRFSTADQAWDVGVSTGEALSIWKARGLADLEQTTQIIADKLRKDECSGNGSLMRIAPVGVALFFRPYAALQIAKEQSQVTHPSLACVEACRSYTGLICGAMRGASKAEMCSMFYQYVGIFDHPVLAQRFARYKTISDWKARTEVDIKSSGWVIDTLEWRPAVVNLGGDSDTAGAVYGALAGVVYGVEAIPRAWMEVIGNAEVVRGIADKFSERVASNVSRG